MVSQEVIDYISKNLKKGYSVEQLSGALVREGWPEEEIEEAMAFLAKTKEKPKADVSREEKTKPKKQEPRKEEKPAKDKEKQKELEEKKAKEEEKARKKKENEEKRKKEEEKKKKDKKAKEKKKKPGERMSRKMLVILAVVVVCAASVAAVAILIFLNVIPLSIFGVPCTESWSCTGWSPEICPQSKIQTRVCTDVNSCGTNENRSEETRACSLPQSAGNFIFDEGDFPELDINASEITRIRRILDINGTFFNTFVTIATIDEERMIRLSVSNELASEIYDYNVQIAQQMNFYSAGQNEYGDRSARFTIQDMNSGMLVVESNGWFLLIDYELADEFHAGELAILFVEAI